MTKTAYLIQPHKADTAVIRQYTIERQLKVGVPEKYIITECGRYFIGANIQQKDWNMKYWNEKEKGWLNEWSYKNNWGYCSNKDEEGYLWPDSSIEDTYLKYSQIIQYSERVKKFKPTYYAEAYKKYPELEIIIKLKMDRLADRIVKGYQWLKINEGSSICERLGIRKSDMKALIREKGEWEYLEVLRLEKEKGIIGQEIRMYDDYPDWQVYMNAIQNMYKNNPINIDIAGSIESISKIDKDVLYKCYNTFYHPSNMAMCFAGNFEPEELLEEIKKRLKPKKAQGDIKRILPEEPKSIVAKEKTANMEVSMPIFVIGIKDTNLSGEIKNKDNIVKKHIAIEILLNMIIGKSSKLYKELYETGKLTKEVYLSNCYDVNL